IGNPPSGTSGFIPTYAGNTTGGDNSALLVSACSGNTILGIPTGTYQFLTNASIPCALSLGTNAILNAGEGATVTLNGTFSCALIQCLSETAGLAPSYAMTTNENPISDAGNFTVIGGYTGFTVEAGQV